MKISEFDDFIIQHNNMISLEWVTGGVTGGSYAGESSYSSVESEIEPEFLELENILEEFDNLKYSTYKKIKNIILIKDSSENGYYGNSTEKRMKYIYLSDLKQVLIEENCFEENNEYIFKI